MTQLVIELNESNSKLTFNITVAYTEFWFLPNLAFRDCLTWKNLNQLSQARLHIPFFLYIMLY